jgi:uncharacterized protein YqgC (DUF456 family)
MTAEQMLGFIVALVLMGAGLIGSIVPGLPGTPLVLLAAIGHRLYFGQASASTSVLVILVLLTLASLGIDYLASMLGAKKLGATWRGILGAMAGAFLGIFFGLPGIILGPFLGALAFEMAGGREFNEAARAGVGAMLGLFLGALGKLACSAAMIGLFAVSVWSRSGAGLDTEAARLAFGQWLG